MKYNFEDFTEENYKQILMQSKDRYKFIFFNEIIKYKDDSEFILLRHDLDFSVHRAYQLAKIERSLGIKSTFFLFLGSEMYNLFEKEIKFLIFKIIELGHQIGLHFDPTSYKIDSQKDLEKFLLQEKNILEATFNIKIRVFSYHVPTKNIMKYDELIYAGMINTYAKFFQEIKYCSDSNGYWRHQRLIDFLTENSFSHKQVLLHPEWWQKEVLSPRDRIQRCIDGRKKFMENYYDNILNEHNRENIREI